METLRLRVPSVKAIAKTAADYRATRQYTDGFIVDFFSSLGTPLAIKALGLYSAGRHRELLELDVDPSEYETAEQFALDYQAVSLLSKARFLNTGLDKRERAKAKFLQFEALCAETNSRFRNHSSLEKGIYADWLFSLRWKIGQILGEFSPEELFDDANWGPGVSLLVRGAEVGPERKYQSENGITREAFTLLEPFLAAQYPLWFRTDRVSEECMHFSEGNRVTYVEKNAKIDRVIAIEPGLNLYFQKGVGRMLRKRMLKAGVDLDHQSVNQQLASAAERLGLATVDFSSASDSIAKELVRYLIPMDWLSVMNSLRCQVGDVDGKPLLWEKFSSMGNGFTWELESLIFYAAALVSCEKLGVSEAHTGVYGDDVIINSQAYVGYEKFCTYLGFKVNAEKSFSSGPFRESCGEHYFSGVSVKPFFLKNELSDVQSVLKLANSVRRYAHRRNLGYGCDARYRRCYSRLVRRLPADIRSIRIPEGYGDGGLVSDWDEACPDLARERAGHDGWEGFFVLHLSNRTVTVDRENVGVLNARLRSLGGTSSSDGNIGRSRSWRLKLRDGKLTRRDCAEFVSETLDAGNTSALRNQTVTVVRQLLVPSWTNLGPWT